MKSHFFITPPHFAPSLQGEFLSRPNRFLANVRLTSSKNPFTVQAHIHDPGRLIELLKPKTPLLLQPVKNPKRKTKYDVIFVKYDNYWVLINSKYHNYIAKQLILHAHELQLPLPPITHLTSEYTYGHSRFDFYGKTPSGHPVFIEVKGCTLKREHKALFPDAPTKRGTKHLTELIQAKATIPFAQAYVLFLIFHKNIACFSPNDAIDPLFTNTFYQAITHGVKILPLTLAYDLSKNVFFVQNLLPLCSSNSSEVMSY